MPSSHEASPPARENKKSRELDLSSDLVSYIRTEAENIVQRINWTLVEELLNKKVERSEDIRRAAGSITVVADYLDTLLRSDNFTNEELISDCFDMVEGAKATLEELQLLYDEPRAAQNDDFVCRPENAFDTAYDVTRTYRDDQGIYRPRPSKASEYDYLPMHDWAINVSDEQHDALTAHLRQLDVYKEVERLNIKGLDLLKLPYDETELREFLTKMPAIAFEGVEGIEFLDEPTLAEVCNNKSTEQQGRTLGAHYYQIQTNTSNILINVDVFNSDYDVFNSAKRLVSAIETVDFDAEETAKNILNHTIAHEVGHALHYKLPVALLREWDVSVEGQHAGLSNYVEDVRQSGDQDSYKREAFADTFSQFYTGEHDIKELAAASSVHFKAMLKILRQTGAVDFPTHEE